MIRIEPEPSVPIGKPVSITCEKLREDETGLFFFFLKCRLRKGGGDLNLGPPPPKVLKKTLSPEQIAELHEMCLKSTYFSYGGSFYEQKEGMVMASPVYAVLANIFEELHWGWHQTD